MDRAGERHQDHAAPRVQRIVGRRARPPALRPLGRPVYPRPHGQHLLLRRNAHEAEQIPKPRLGIERLVGVEHSNLLRITGRQFRDPPVVLVPVAANPLLAVLRLVLGKRARAVGVVVPTGGGLPGPVVRGQRHRLVEPLAEAGDHLLPRPAKADDPDIRFQGNGVFQVRQIEQPHVAQQPRLGVRPEPGKPLPQYPPGIDGPPRQQRRLLERAYRLVLLIEHLCQRPRAATACANSENDGLLHWCVSPPAWS